MTALDTLVRDAARGDRDAFADLVGRTQTLVCSIAMAILRDVEASQDVAQDVFLSAWRDLRRLREPASFLPWLRQMTRNRAHHVLRSRVRERRVLSDADADVLLEAVAIDTAATPAAALIAREDHARLAEAIDALPDEAREVVTLFYREGRSVRQVADLLGMREDAVKQRLSRARSRLREALLDEIGETLRTTAPGAALTIAIMAGTIAAPSTAAAAAGAAAGAGLSASKAGATGAVGAAGASLLAKIASLFLGVSGGAIFGVAGVLIGLRPMFRRARDTEEVQQLRRFSVVALLTVLAAIGGFAIDAWITPRQTWLAILTFALFASAISVEYMIWLPRIIERRLALERLEDPDAARRQRNDRIRCWIGYAAGMLSGSAGLIWGLLR
jgi:RNA polymerase sigma factor (sigma-70 family)